MNWVPLLFIDDVCHQLNKQTFNQVSQLSGSWSKFGSKHHKKRREFSFQCRVSNQEVSCEVRDRANLRIVAVADLNLEFDRITYFAFNSEYSDHLVSLREFESDILPTVAPLVTNCCWPYLAASAQNRFFFNAFKNCPGFSEITVEEQGQESRDFVARQVRLGNVQRLNFYGTGKWPEADKLTETLKIFLSSTRFYVLYYSDLFRDHYELFELFLERALWSELKRGARIITLAENLDKNRLLALCPEYRVYLRKAAKHERKKGGKFKNDRNAWRIPRSNLRIALRHDTNCSGILKMRLEVE